MHEALRPRDYVDRLFVPRKGRGRGLTIIEERVDASIQQLVEYIKIQRETDYRDRK